MTNVFWNGFEAKVIADVSSDFSKVIIQTTEDLSLDRDRCVGAQFYVNKSELEPLIYDRYVVGAPVKSKVGSLVGRISGFEYHTNRAVVISDKIENYRDKRDRYAYKFDELIEYDDKAFEFFPGRWYKINARTKLFAVDSVFNSMEVMLFDGAGKIVYRGIPKKTNLDWLNVKHCINSVKQL